MTTVLTIGLCEFHGELSVIHIIMFLHIQTILRIGDQVV